MLHLKAVMLSLGVLAVAAPASASWPPEEVEGPPAPPTDEQLREERERREQIRHDLERRQREQREAEEREANEPTTHEPIGVELVLSGGIFAVQVANPNPYGAQGGGGFDGGAELGVRFGDHWSVRGRVDLLLGIMFPVAGVEGIIEWTPVVHWSFAAGVGYQSIGNCCAMYDAAPGVDYASVPPNSITGPRFPVAVWWNSPRGKVPFGHAFRLGLRIVPQVGDDDRDMPFSISESFLIGYVWR